jgi:peroxiredoxin
MNTPTTPNTPAPGQSRRLLLAGATATVAIAAGAGWNWWQSQRPAPVPGAPDGVPDFWDKTFTSPMEGQPVALRQFQHQPLLLNFWATWCPPCVAEMPLLNAFFQQQHANGWQVLGLAIDKPAAVQQFLARQPVDFPVALASTAGRDLARALGNLGGGLPFTVLLDANGQVRQRKIGQVTAQLLQSWSKLH